MLAACVCSHVSWLSVAEVVLAFSHVEFQRMDFPSAISPNQNHIVYGYWPLVKLGGLS